MSLLFLIVCVFYFRYLFFVKSFVFIIRDRFFLSGYPIQNTDDIIRNKKGRHFDDISSKATAPKSLRQKSAIASRRCTVGIQIAFTVGHAGIDGIGILHQGSGSILLGNFCISITQTLHDALCVV